MDSIYLQGSDDVRAAAHMMRGAAEDMNRAASSISNALEHQRGFMNDWLDRFEQIMQAAGPKPVTCPTCKVNMPRDKHPCPYRVSVSMDTVTQCACCDECQEKCSGEVP